MHTVFLYTNNYNRDTVFLYINTYGRVDTNGCCKARLFADECLLYRRIKTDAVSTRLPQQATGLGSGLADALQPW